MSNCWKLGFKTTLLKVRSSTDAPFDGVDVDVYRLGIIKPLLVNSWLASNKLVWD